MSRSTEAQLVAGVASPPVYRLVLRPRFTPWPLALLITAEGAPHRLCLFGAHRHMGSGEPHTCLVCSSADGSALVLVHVRIDGTLEFVSNSSAAVWSRLEDALLAKAPQGPSLADFELLARGWRAEGPHALAFATLARHEWRQRQTERNRNRQQKADAARKLAQAQSELRHWLEELGLEMFAPAFIAEGVDLDSLQYLTEDDLKRMGVSQLAVRRKLMAARRTQAQYKALTERLESMEREKESTEARALKVGEVAHATAQTLEETQKQLKALQGALAMKTEELNFVNKKLDEARASIDQEGDKMKEWQQRACAFADDSGSLQERLAALAEAQRETLRESKAYVQERTKAIMLKSQAENSTTKSKRQWRAAAKASLLSGVCAELGRGKGGSSVSNVLAALGAGGSGGTSVPMRRKPFSGERPRAAEGGREAEVPRPPSERISGLAGLLARPPQK